MGRCCPSSLGFWHPAVVQLAQESAAVWPHGQHSVPGWALTNQRASWPFSGSPDPLSCPDCAPLTVLPAPTQCCAICWHWAQRGREMGRRLAGKAAVWGWHYWQVPKSHFGRDVVSSLRLAGKQSVAALFHQHKAVWLKLQCV